MSVPSISFYPPLPPAAALRRPAERLPYPLGEPGCVLFSRGRHAIWHGVRALGLAPGDAVLTPAWHHGAEVEALRRAGLEVVFYGGTPALEPDLVEVDALLGPRTRALFLTHFLGFPQDAERWRGWCDARGLLLIEDVAHAWLATSGGRPAGTFGDAAVWCLFKSLGLPDGAALRVRGSAAPRGSGAGRQLGAAAAAKRHAAWALQRLPAVAQAVPHSNGRVPYDHAAEIALGDPADAPSAATVHLLPRVGAEHAAARRRAHYALLLEELGRQVPEPFGTLPAGAAPLGLPIECGRKGEALALLARRGIDAVDFWSQPHPLLEAGGFPELARRRASTVLLPVHHELRPADLERIACAARVRPRAPDLVVERAKPSEGLSAEWRELAQRCRNVFAAPEWISAWCRHFLRGRELELIALRSPGGELVGLVPLYRLLSRPLRVLRLAGHGPGDELGPLCAPRDRARVARSLVRALARLDADLLVAEQVSRAAGWSSLTGARVLASEGSPIVRFDALDWSGFTSRLSRKLRKELGRHERKLAREHTLRYRRGGGTPEQLGRDLDTLFALHDARWGPGASSFSTHAGFQREFAALAAERDWLRLWFLEIDGEPVAANYGFRYAGVEFDYQGGRHPDWATSSVGLVLMAHAMRAALEDGVREYRLLRGGEHYKYRFATEDPGLETFAVARGGLGTAAAALGAAAPRALSSALRRRVAP